MSRSKGDKLRIPGEPTPPGTPAAGAAESLRPTLAQAGAPSTGPSQSGELDRAALETLKNAGDRETVLDDLGPAPLAGLLERCTARLAGDAADDLELRQACWDTLDVIRRPAVLRKIPRDEIDAWSARILAAVQASRLTVGPLFRQRAESYGSKVLFRLLRNGRVRELSWRVVASRVEQLAAGLLALDDSAEPGPVAILSENRIEMALLDLACLTSGIVNVMVPANSTSNDVGFILRHSRARTVVVSGGQWPKLLPNRGELPDLRHVVRMDGESDPDHGVYGFDRLSTLADVSSAAARRSLALDPADLVTVMYTSGTTGTPKGIQFSHQNLVFKRFARALALPEIGEDDRFLCFLPLFHTFGRFFEMLGCVFWGSTYCFLPNTSADTLVRTMQSWKPTVFISVPKKWMQLHELITQQADPHQATDDELREAIHSVTGGKLRWGLSAAGYLDSDIFRSFQRHGVELMSGFGMTEGTGGITMTPPGEYKEDSLGCALPGIELDLAADGELRVRGPYVMTGYLDPASAEADFDADGWFPTGDLMKMDSDGHIRLVDRKKEIYKNVKGETIAPQRIENMFRDIESFGRVFLVGDHREYNTLLVYPNPNYTEMDFASAEPEAVYDHFRSLVISVNKFLAPFERIVDFAVIDRDLDAERGELTAKGTPRRRAVERAFSDVIRTLYRRTNVRAGGLELTLPNWLFQAVGLTAQDVRVDDGGVSIRSTGARLTVEAEDETTARIGSCRYCHPPGPVDLGGLLATPGLWLGNEELFRFADLPVSTRERTGRAARKIRWCGRVAPYRPDPEIIQALSDAAAEAPGDRRWDLLDVDRAARLAATEDDGNALPAVDFLAQVLAQTDTPLAAPALLVLARCSQAPSDAVRRRAFLVLIGSERESRFPETLKRFLGEHSPLLNDTTRDALCDRDLPGDRLTAFIDTTHDLCVDPGQTPETARVALALLRFLADYGATHPTSYRRVRAFLVRMSLFAAGESMRSHAELEVNRLRAGFRAWLGPNSLIAVDPETSQEYRWADVVAFEDDVDPADQARLLAAIKDTALLREAVFLFSNGVLIRLSDLPPGGVWIRLLGSRHGKSVYRIGVQTRYQGHFDFAVNVNHELLPSEVEEEIHWLILGGDARSGEPLVEDFGGYWPERDLWSEEFIPGATLDRAMRRLAKRDDSDQRLIALWPFMSWTALSAYVDFWHRSGGRWEIADAGMTNVIVPTNDFHTGVRIVSVSARRHHAGVLEMIRTFMDKFIRPAHEQYPALEGVVGWDTVFASLLEVLGPDRGPKTLRRTLERDGDSMDAELRTALEAYVSRIELEGFRPRRLHFAIERYRRWEALSDDATPQARARTLQELYDTYGLQRLEQDYPELRVRFFRDTVFRGSAPAFAEGLDALIRRLRDRELLADELLDAVADLRSKSELAPGEDYFLARISLPYLRPEDQADFVYSHLGGDRQSEIVVTFDDHDGNSIRVRHALNPKEVGRLHRLFLAAKLDVRFRPEHRYLVALNERLQIIAGIYYEVDEGGTSAHLEKIVVSEAYRRKGVAEGLMQEFFNRLRTTGTKTVTTGFFRPQYFYGFGFRIEKRYAGLVKSLVEDADDHGAETATP